MTKYTILKPSILILFYTDFLSKSKDMDPKLTTMDPDTTYEVVTDPDPDPTKSLGTGSLFKKFLQLTNLLSVPPLHTSCLVTYRVLI